MPDASQTIEPTRGAIAGRAARRRARGVRHARRTVPRTATARASHSVRGEQRFASAADADRVVKDTAAAALFSAHSWYVAPPPPPPAPVVYQPPPPPTAPPLPFAFMGSYRTDRAEARSYYLTAGDRVYDVKVGDTLDNTYSVDGVKSGQLLLTYMPLKIQQSLAVGDE